MPIHIDILESKVLGREYKRGRQEGKLEGELTGGLKVWAEERLASRTTAELEDLSVRPLDAQSLEELLN